jgi:hypothetical protein
MIWPGLVAALLAYTAIGTVTAVGAHTWLWRDLINHGPRDGGLRTAWAWICCMALCLLAGLTWPILLTAWTIRRRTP